MASCLVHFSHCHVLEKTESWSQQFICDLCVTEGSGPRYRCDACDFVIHENCAMLPETISFFAHPWHSLHLGPAGKTDGPQVRVCDLCNEKVEGFFYRCRFCNFDVHPHCTTTKHTVHTELHPEHSLCLVPGLTFCSACNEFDGSIWIYRCGMCNIDLHMKCLHGPIKPKVSTEDEHVNTNNSGSRRGRLRRFLHQVGTEVAVETTTQIISNKISSLFN